MKINHEYLKNLLIAFENTTGPDTILSVLEEAGFSKDDSDFIFHMRLLNDNKLIIRIDSQAGFGYELRQSVGGGSYRWIETPLRMTAKGHDFIADLRQQEVWQTIKAGFKDEGLSTLMSVTKSLAEGFAKKKIKDLTGFDVS